MARKKETPEVESTLVEEKADVTESAETERMEQEKTEAEEEYEEEDWEKEEDSVTADTEEEVESFNDGEELFIPNLQDDEEEEYEESEEAFEESTEGENADEDKETVQRRSYRSRLLPEGVGGEEGIKRAGKRKKRKLYRTDVIHTEEGIKRVNRTNTKRYQEYVELAASKKNKTILKGTLLSRKEENGNIYGIVSYGDYFTVSIPFEYLVDMSIQHQPNVNMDSIPVSEEEKEENKKKMLLSQQKSIINRRIGSEVDFIVLNLDEAKGIAIGSHIDAMVKKARRNYTSQSIYQLPECMPGAVIEGQIMQVNSIGIYVEALGVETFIRQDEIEWNRVSDISEMYNVGDKINIRLLGVTPHVISTTYRNITRNINTVAISASVKQVEKNPNEEFYDSVSIRQVGQGIVTQLTEFDIFVIFNNKVSVKCGLFEGAVKQPGPGSKVLVQITDMHDDDFKIWGTIKAVIKYAEN